MCIEPSAHFNTLICINVYSKPLSTGKLFTSKCVNSNVLFQMLNIFGPRCFIKMFAFLQHERPF